MYATSLVGCSYSSMEYKSLLLLPLCRTPHIQKKDSSNGQEEEDTYILSSYYYIRVLILLYTCPHTLYTCPHTCAIPRSVIYRHVGRQSSEKMI